MLLYIICGVMIVAGLLMIFFPKLTVRRFGNIYYENPTPSRLLSTRVMGVVVIIISIYYMLIDM